MNEINKEKINCFICRQLHNPKEAILLKDYIVVYDIDCMN